MATTMHRLQISLHKSEMQYLEARAQREGRSIAEVIRQLVQKEAETRSAADVESVWEIAGIGEESLSLVEGIPVSERPALYLAAAVKPKTREPRTRRRTGARQAARR